MRRVALGILRHALLVAGAAMTLVPDRYFPGGQGLDVEGTFEGRPVEIPWTRTKDAPYNMSLDLEKGRCEFVLLDASGRTLIKFTAQEFTYSGRIDGCGKLQFLPSEDAGGRYHVRVGTLMVLGPLITATRVLIFVSCLAGIAASYWGWRVPLPGQNRRRWLVGALIMAFSGLVLYSVVHEGGHVLFGMLFGGELDPAGIRWTIFSGEEPHAAFRHLPPDAFPWMTAGGVLLPTLIGLVLVVIWFWRGGRMSWWLQFILVIPALALLLGNIGLFADAGHTLPLASHFGVHGVLAHVAALGPAIVTLIVFAFILRWVARATRAPQESTSR